MKKQHILSILILVAWIILILALSSGGWAQGRKELPADLQLDYLESSLKVSYAREALTAEQLKQSAALARANMWCPVKLVGNRLECAK